MTYSNQNIIDQHLNEWQQNEAAVIAGSGTPQQREEVAEGLRRSFSQTPELEHLTDHIDANSIWLKEFRTPAASRHWWTDADCNKPMVIITEGDKGNGIHLRITEVFIRSVTSDYEATVGISSAFEFMLSDSELTECHSYGEFFGEVMKLNCRQPVNQEEVFKVLPILGYDACDRMILCDDIQAWAAQSPLADVPSIDGNIVHPMPDYTPIIEMLAQSNVDQDYFDEVARDYIIDIDDTQFIAAGSRHRFHTSHRGSALALMFARAESDVYDYVLLTISEISGSTRISFDVEGCGSVELNDNGIYCIQSAPYTDFFIPTVKFDSAHPMTKELNKIYGWECDDEYDELNDLVLKLQGWLYS